MPMTDKQSKFCTFSKLQLKEVKEDFHVSGFVATSHPDRASEGEYAGDIIPKSTLQKIAADINNKYTPHAGAVSDRHDHLKSDPEDVISLNLSAGSVYKMHGRQTWHYVRPITTCYSIMVNGLPWEEQHTSAPTTVGKDLEKFTDEQLSWHLDDFVPLLEKYL